MQSIFSPACLLSSSNVPNCTQDRFLRTLPFVNAVACLDFGPYDVAGTKFPRSDAIYVRKISGPRFWQHPTADAPVVSGGAKGDVPAAAATTTTTTLGLSYVSDHKLLAENAWEDDRQDESIRNRQAHDFWRQVGYGIVCTGSMKEARYLKECCRVSSVVHVDEEYLRLRISELYERLQVGCRPDIFNHLDTDSGNWKELPNCQYRCHRLILLVEEFRRMYFENFENSEIQISLFE